MPEFSVVIPLYNKGRHIARALESVLFQTVRNYEIIVIDDGSTDNGAEIVKGFSDNRIRLIRQTNAGVSAARNKGIEAAKAMLIAFLDADDYWRPDHLKTIMRLHNNYSHAGLYAAAYEVTMPGGITFIPRFNDIPNAPWEGIVENYFKTALGNPLAVSATVVKRDVFDKVGLFNPESGYGEDADMWARIALDYQIAFSNSLSAVYRLDADNRICSVPRAELYPVLLQTMEEALQNSNLPGDKRYYMEEYVYSKMMASAKVFAEKDDVSTARSILKKCKTKYFLRNKIFLLMFCFLPGTIRHGLISLNRLLREIILYKVAYYLIWKRRRNSALNTSITGSLQT